MIQIVIHCLPHEIDQLEQTLIGLKRNSVKFDSTKDKFLLDVLLNLNLVDWGKSKIPKELFINKFNNLKKLTETWAQTQFEIEEKNQILGCVSHRRRAFNNSQNNSIIVLDTDIIFSENTLYYLYYSDKQLKQTEQNYVLTPQIPKMWDNSWDCLVNEKYLNRDCKEFLTRDPYLYYETLEEVKLKPIDSFKFGGGWFTLFSNNLTKLISIPESFGHYGMEDTYIMFCSQFLKQKGIKINQFVLENEIIAEDHYFLFRKNLYNNYLFIKDKQEEFRQNATVNFEKEIQNFIINNTNK